MLARYKPTAQETLEILNSPWLSTKDICKLACVGMNKALEIKKDIANELKMEGYKLPSSNVLPTDKVIEYLNLNVSYLKKIAN